MDEQPGVMECLLCERRWERPMTLRDLHKIVRDAGYQGRLTEDGTAIAVICPDCGDGDCPRCGRPGAEHQDRHGAVLRCDGSLR